MKTEEEKRLIKQRRILRIMFIIAAIFCLPLLYLTIVPMLWWLSIPFPSFLEPMQYPLSYALVQIGLTIPIILLGIKFIFAGLKAVFKRSPNMDSLIAIGAIASLAYSLYSTYQVYIGNFGASDNLYFAISGAILTIALLGRLQEATSKSKTLKETKKYLGNTQSHSGTLKELKATGEENSNYFDWITELKEEGNRPIHHTARMVDIIAGYYVSIVIALGILAIGVWIINGQSPAFVLTIFLTILLIACPSAIGIASSAAIAAGMRKGKKFGILIKDGDVLEKTRKINTIVLGKSGIITEGKPEVTDIFAVGDISNERLLQIAASVEQGSGHHLGEAIIKHAENNDLDLLPVDHCEPILGYGVTGEVDSIPILIGSRQFMEERKVSIEDPENNSDQFASEGKTPIYIAMEGKMAGIVALTDRVKESSATAIQKLNSLGLEVILLSSDHRKTAEVVASQVGISRVLASVPPLEKHKEIVKLQTEGRKVAVVGEDIYDVLALTHADIGIAFGSGSQVSLEYADIMLTRNEIMDVPAAIKIGKKSVRIMGENLFWAFGYHVIGIPIAAGLLHLFGGPLLNPVLATAAMILGTASVFINTIRLKRLKPYL